jgi:hypothetical protein
MATDRSYVETNRVELDRLRGLVKRLSDAELSQPMPGGWTVAGVLAHLALWDQRIVVLVDEWGVDGRGTAPPLIEEASVGWINDAAKPLCLGLAPREAARIAVEAAAAADQRVANLSDAALAANAAAGTPIGLLRAEHRREHIEEIEKALAE